MNAWRQLLLPVAFSVIAFALMDPRHWGDIRQGVMFALSILSAAVFVRLARGMPITNTDYFEVQEIRSLSVAVQKVMRRMMVLIGIAFSSILGLGFIGVLHKALDNAPFLPPIAKQVMSSSLTALLVFAIVFTFVRAFYLVRGDYDLVELQSNLMTKAVERRHAKEVQERLEAADKDAPFKASKGYGKPLDTH